MPRSKPNPLLAGTGSPLPEWWQGVAGRASRAKSDPMGFLADVLAQTYGYGSIDEMRLGPGNRMVQPSGLPVGLGAIGSVKGIDKLKAIMRELNPSDVATGNPVSFHYGRNTEKSPYMGEMFAQHREPAGRYITSMPYDPKRQLPGYEYGTHTFSNPLVMDFGGMYRDPTNWKSVLSDKYGGKTGKSLSKAIAKQGFDGIITIMNEANYPYVSEIVDLSMFHE